MGRYVVKGVRSLGRWVVRLLGRCVVGGAKNTKPQKAQKFTENPEIFSLRSLFLLRLCVNLGVLCALGALGALGVTPIDTDLHRFQGTPANPKSLIFSSVLICVICVFSSAPLCAPLRPSASLFPLRLRITLCVFALLSASLHYSLRLCVDSVNLFL